MARARRKSSATTPEGRLIASRIQDARRRGLTNKEIGTSFGINERTVRKIVAGETPGTRIYKEKAQPNKQRASTNAFTVDIEIAKGEVRSKNVILPDYTNAKGQRVAPTPFDVFRYPNLDEVAEREAENMRQRYQLDNCQRSYCGHSEDDHEGSENGTKYPCTLCECPDFVEFNPVIVALRPVATYRKPALFIRGILR